jgi:hypothetical protein
VAALDERGDAVSDRIYKDGSTDGSLRGIDEVDAIGAARIEAVLKSEAVIQGVEQPVAD